MTAAGRVGFSFGVTLGGSGVPWRLNPARGSTGPEPGFGTGAAGTGGGVAGSGDIGPMAMYSAKDFIRVQIERHWYLDRAAIGAGAFTLSLHLMLTADGHVSLAEIVDSMGYGEDAAYLAAARSLRGAALLSSPLTLPPGGYAQVKDVILTFSPKDVLR